MRHHLLLLRMLFVVLSLVPCQHVHARKNTNALRAFQGGKGTDKVDSWAEIVKQYKDAVVRITAYTHEYDILEPYLAPSQGMGVGTGFFISADGYLLTNFHVVDQAAMLYIQVPSLGKEQFDVEYIGGNPGRDIALLKVTEESFKKITEKLGVVSLHYIQRGNSDSLVEAQEVMALGYPLGQENLKIAIGNISGRESMYIGECIQTTAPVNPGNSGGPFLDRTGKVIGVCVLKSIGTEGIAYMIPINNVEVMLKELNKNSIVQNPYWGLTKTPTNNFTLAYLGNPLDGGVYVTEVKKGSLAEEYGLAKGDVITAINGTKIDRYGYVSVSWTKDRVSIDDFISRVELGSKVVLTFYRNGEQHEVVFAIKGRDEFAIDRFYPWYQDDLPYEVIGGMVFVKLTMNHIDFFKEVFAAYGIDAYAIAQYERFEKRCEPRVILTKVFPTSSLHRTMCFRMDDRIISKINGMPVKTIEEFRQAVRAGKHNEYLTVECEGGSFVALPIIDILAEEEMLSERYGYQISPLAHELYEALPQTSVIDSTDKVIEDDLFGWSELDNILES